MKVLIIGPIPEPVNGVSIANETLIKNLTARGIACEVINTSANTLSSNQGSKFSIKKALNFLHTYTLVYKIFTCDVTYSTPGQTFFGIFKYAPFYLLSQLLKRPYIIHVHGNYLGKEYTKLTGIRKKLFYFFLARASAGIVLSESLRKNFDGLLAPEKVFVVENFATDNLYESENISKPTDKLRIIYLSNLMKEKGIIDLLDALLLLKSQKIDFEATIAGSVEQGLESEVESRLIELGKMATYYKTIYGKQKKDLLLGSNVFVLPTYYIMEGQPISILEGMATGNIIVTSNHAGIPDIITEENGYMITNVSARAIQDCFLEVNTDLIGKVFKYAAHNKSYALGRFTERKFTDNIADVLLKTIASR